MTAGFSGLFRKPLTKAAALETLEYEDSRNRVIFLVLVELSGMTILVTFCVKEGKDEE